MACIAGAIAQAYYGGVPLEIADQAKEKLPAEFIAIQTAFSQRFIPQ